MRSSVVQNAAGTNSWATEIPHLELAWWGGWTSVGLLFATQLIFHYRMPPFLSLYWGLTDWYLWGALGVLVVAITQRLRRARCSPAFRRSVIAAIALAVMASHVALTIFIGMFVAPIDDAPILDQFGALFVKKLTLNTIAFAAIASIADALTTPASVTDSSGDASCVGKATPAQIGGEVTPGHIHGARGQRSRLLSPSDILSASAAGNYVDLTASDGTWMVRDTLRHLELQLSDAGFIQVSRSELVNLAHLTGTRTEGGRLFLVMTDGRAIPVAKRRRADVQRCLRHRFDS